MPRHFIDIADFDTATLTDILADSLQMKTDRDGQAKGIVEPGSPLDGKVLAMIFEKPSTRTRVSFDVAMRQLGGSSLMLSSSELQIGRGETIADTARVLSRFVDAIMIRTFGHNKLTELAEHATVPVINGLTDFSHPCQVMADLLTLQERRGDLASQVITWVGDGNNVTTSWIHAAARFGFELRVAGPQALHPEQGVLDWAESQGCKLTVTDDAASAVSGADCVVTDVWISIHEEGQGTKHNMLKPYQVNAELMSKAKPDALFMHCLPAHREEEVTAEVIDGPQSVVFDEAENRLHIQKGVLAWCLSDHRDSR